MSRRTTSCIFHPKRGRGCGKRPVAAIFQKQFINHKIIEMKKILFLLTGVTLLAFTACSDNDNVFKAEVQYPAGTVENQLTTDAWHSTYQLEVKADGAWRIETNDYFLTVSPESGTGDATVTLTLEDNLGERRKAGKLAFIFEGHEEQNRELRVMQKYAGDYDDNAAGELDTSNKIYAVGYSYDATGYWASPNSVRKQIFCTQNLIDDKQLVIGPVQISTSIEMLSGSIITDMTNQLATKAHVEGGFGKFKAEANASFDMSHASNNNYEFASTYYNMEVRKASIETDYKSLMRSKRYLSTDAYYAINGVPYLDEWTGEAYTDYPSTTEGFKRLIKEYGTHVIVSATLGGRVRHSMEVDVSKVKTDYDIKAFAQASYDGLFVSGGASVDKKYKESYEENRNNINIKVDVLGGDENAAKQLMVTDGLKKENLDAWAATVKDKDLALVNFDQYSLVPIYELVNEGLTMERNNVDGKERKQKLKEYIETGIQDVDDYSSYDCGTVTKITIPDFLDRNNRVDESLVETVNLDGQIVAFVCREYIPNINYNNRVTVIYPARNNNPCFNMGFFIGGYGHKPARVSWDGTNVAVQEYPDMDFGAAKEVYLRGATVYSKAPEGTKSFSGSSTPYTLVDVDKNSYPTVKIFNNIWTRQDYRCTHARTGGRLEYKRDGTYYYYSIGMAKKEFFAPSGWRVPTKKDYEEIKEKLEANLVGNLGETFWAGDNGILGYGAYQTGWWHGGQITHIKGQVDHLTLDNHIVRIQERGSFLIDPWGDNDPLQLRLIKEF